MTAKLVNMIDLVPSKPALVVCGRLKECRKLIQSLRSHRQYGSLYAEVPRKGRSGRVLDEMVYHKRLEEPAQFVGKARVADNRESRWTNLGAIDHHDRSGRRWTSGGHGAC